MTKAFYIFIVLHLWFTPGYGQGLYELDAKLDSIRTVNGCLVCQSYKKEYKKGAVLKSVLTSSGGKGNAVVSFEVVDPGGASVPYSEIIFADLYSILYIYYTDGEGKTTIEMKEGAYDVCIKGYFKSDSIRINKLALKAGDIREIQIDAGESRCLHAQKYYTNGSPAQGYTRHYYNNFSNWAPPFVVDNAYPPYPVPDSTLSYWGNGQLKETQYYTNGEKSGTWRDWYPDGKLARERGYLNGKEEGPWRSRGRNGELLEYANYKAGLAIGNYCSFFLLEGKIVASSFEKSGAFKTTYINLKTKEIRTVHVSAKGFTTKETNESLKADLDVYEYKITERGDLVLRKKID